MSGYDVSEIWGVDPSVGVPGMVGWSLKQMERSNYS